MRTWDPVGLSSSAAGSAGGRGGVNGGFGVGIGARDRVVVALIIPVRSGPTESAPACLPSTAADVAEFVAAATTRGQGDDHLANRSIMQVA